MSAILDIQRNQPRHQVREYRSWDLPFDFDAPSDMAWVSIEQEAQEAHAFLPFLEPSLILSLRTDPLSGERLDAELLVGSACPDGGWYRPRRGFILLGLRLPPEICTAAYGISPRDYRDMLPQPAPIAIRQHFSTVLIMARSAPLPRLLAAMHEALGSLARSTARPVHQALRRLRASEGRISCAALAREVAVSERQLRRLFMDEVGLSPKACARRLRLTAAMIAAEQPRAAGWAQIAHDHGYADQAHLIRDCRSLLSISPEALRRQRQGDGRKVQ